MPDIHCLLGGSYPADLYIEDALCSRLPWPLRRYDDLLQRHTAGRKITKMDTGLHCLAQEFGPAAGVVLIGRSSGARLATKFAARYPDRVAAVVALSYPFRHPDREAEPDRVTHLAGLGRPTLILQGLQDEYGGQEARQLYPLSPAITVEFLDCAHDMRLGAAQWDAVCARIAQFLHHNAAA